MLGLVNPKLTIEKEPPALILVSFSPSVCIWKSQHRHQFTGNNKQQKNKGKCLCLWVPNLVCLTFARGYFFCKNKKMKKKNTRLLLDETLRVGDLGIIFWEWESDEIKSLSIKPVCSLQTPLTSNTDIARGSSVHIRTFPRLTLTAISRRHNSLFLRVLRNLSHYGRTVLASNSIRVDKLYYSRH